MGCHHLQTASFCPSFNLVRPHQNANATNRPRQPTTILSGLTLSLFIVSVLYVWMYIHVVRND